MKINSTLFIVLIFLLFGCKQSRNETFDIGRVEGLPVNEEYADMGNLKLLPGQLHKVVFDIKNPEELEVTASEFSDID